MALNKDDIVKQATTFTGDQIQDAWHSSHLSLLQLISTNKEYRALPKSVWDSILAEHLTIHEYVPEFFDCDAFSVAFCGLVAFKYEINGIARVLDSSSHHSYNAVLVSEDGKTCTWQTVEPQADIFMDDPKPANVNITTPDGAYRARNGFAVTV